MYNVHGGNMNTWKWRKNNGEKFNKEFAKSNDAVKFSDPHTVVEIIRVSFKFAIEIN